MERRHTPAGHHHMQAAKRHINYSAKMPAKCVRFELQALANNDEQFSNECVRLRRQELND